MNFKRFLRDQRKAFTLAEVVIVMAILSIMMVAFAPVITKKSNSETDSFRTFQRAQGNHGIYYGTPRDTKPVVIGDTGLRYNTGADGYNPKLVLAATTTGSDSAAQFTPHVGFLAEAPEADKKYATGQLLVAGGFTQTSDLTAMNNFVPQLMPIAYAEELTEQEKLEGEQGGQSGESGESGSANSDGTGSNGDYLNPQDYANNGISVVLGGNPVGRYAYNVGASNMTIVGGNACPGAIDGVNNLTCIGANAGKGTTLGGNNVLIGNDAGQNTTLGNNNVLIGYRAGTINSTSVSAVNSVYIGEEAGYNKHGSNNIYIGYRAGYAATVDGSPETNAIYIGTEGATISKVQLGNQTLQQWVCNKFNGSYNSGTGFCTVGTSSDARLKNVGKPFDVGIELINKIEPVNFTYKRDENKIPHVGVIAQDLIKIFPNAVNENSDGYYYIRTEDMFYAAINAIKELYQMFLGHNKRIEQLEARNAVLEQQNKELLEMYNDLAKRVERLDKKKIKEIKLTPMPVFEEETTEADEAAQEEVNSEDK